MMTSWSFSVFLLSSLIIFSAFFIRSLTGFGSALVSIPLLTLLFDLKFAVPLEALIEAGFSLLLIRSVYPSIHKTTLFPLIIGTILGSLLGTYILYAFAGFALKRILGLVIIGFAFDQLWQQWRGKTTTAVRPALSDGWGLFAGAVGGIFGGLFGTSGPPFVVYLNYKLRKKTILRASLIGLFSIDYGWRVVVFAATGLITADMLIFAVLLAPAMALGAFLGNRIHFTMAEYRFRQLVAGLLIASGTLLLIQ